MISIHYDIRQTGKGNEAHTNDNDLSVTLQDNLSLSSGQCLFVKNGLDLKLAADKKITLASGAGLELYEGAKISNINETAATGLAGVTITEKAITGYYNCNSASMEVVLTGATATP